MRMTATFPKVNDRSAHLALFEWPDGSAATTPMYGHPKRLPHDLGHYVGEAHFRPPYGFWNLAAQQAPFHSLTLVRGRWPRGRQEWLDRVRRKHGAEMLKAESVDVARLAAPDFDLEARWATMARALRRAYSYTDSNPFDGATRADFVACRGRARELTEAWERVPWGGALVVSWPPDTPPKILETYEAEEPPACKPRRKAKKHAVR